MFDLALLTVWSRGGSGMGRGRRRRRRRRRRKGECSEHCNLYM